MDDDSHKMADLSSFENPPISEVQGKIASIGEAESVVLMATDALTGEKMRLSEYVKQEVESLVVTAQVYQSVYCPSEDCDSVLRVDPKNDLLRCDQCDEDYEIPTIQLIRKRSKWNPVTK